MTALVGVGSPQYTLHTAATAAARVFEIHRDPPVLATASFPQARRVAGLLKKALGVESVEVKTCGELDDLISGVDLAVPTSASVKLALCIAVKATRLGKAVVHFMFPFGPWTGLYYPLIPRWLVWGFYVAGDAKLDDVQQYVDCRKFFELDRGVGPLRREVGAISCEINQRLNKSYIYNNDSLKREEEVVLEVRDGALSLYVAGRLVSTEKLKKKTPSAKLSNTSPYGVEEFLKTLPTALDSPEEDVHQLAMLLGYATPELEPGGSYVLDTSAIYGGVHNLPLEEYRLHIPYCAQVELLDALTKKERRLSAELAHLALQEIAAKAGYIATQPYKCDVVLPIADRIQLEGKVIITRDKRALQVWQRHGLVAAELRHGQPKANTYALLQTYAAVRIYNRLTT
ncbi:MAG: hypothetical protein QXT13_09845 [Pyrobaculum sp.]